MTGHKLDHAGIRILWLRLRRPRLAAGVASGVLIYALLFVISSISGRLRFILSWDAGVLVATVLLIGLRRALPDTLKPVREHLSQSLTLLSNRQKPDYRNSIKESISAVESLAKIISKQNSATLGPALDAVEKKAKLHAVLKQAFQKLYGYTSDAQGIRHALMDEATLDAEDAKFMLVSCSAFVNYLVVKAQKAGIRI